MKIILALVLGLFITSSAFPEGIDIYDREDGYRNFDVTREGKHSFSIYDYERGAYMDAEIKRHGKEVEVYDYKNGSFKTYELERQSDGGLEVYDPEESKYFDIDRSELEDLMPDESKDRKRCHRKQFGWR